MGGVGPKSWRFKKKNAMILCYWVFGSVMVDSTKISKKKKICFFNCQTTIIVIFLSFVVVCVRGEILLISNILQHRKPKNNNINDNFSSSFSYIRVIINHF